MYTKKEAMRSSKGIHVYVSTCTTLVETEGGGLRQECLFIEFENSSTNLLTYKQACSVKTSLSSNKYSYKYCFNYTEETDIIWTVTRTYYLMFVTFSSSQYLFCI